MKETKKKKKAIPGVEHKLPQGKSGISFWSGQQKTYKFILGKQNRGGPVYIKN